MFEIRLNFETQKFQDSVKRIFQSVGLAPLITSTDQNGTFVSYQDIHTPSRIRNTVLKVRCDYEKHDLQTVGGILLETEMRSEVCEGEGDDNLNNPIEKSPAEVIEIIEEDEIDDDEYEESEEGEEGDYNTGKEN